MPKYNIRAQIETAGDKRAA